MAETHTCPVCGAKMPDNLPAGPCASCLFAEGLPPGEAAQTEATRRSTIRLSLPSLAEKPGDRIGRYKLLQQIGEGGCGVVYMAQQEDPVKRLVALKVIKPGMDTKAVLGRFEAERQALALMDHPHIAKVFDAGATENGRPFFVMELVRGVPMTGYCDEHKLPTAQRLKLFIQVCQAIHHAHQKGIIHRDIKPSNILVAEYDGVPAPKVIDFGIAKATAGQTLTDKTMFTAFDQFIGTPAYMSPEQARLSGVDIDNRSDIYSLGVMLYELLTGKTPFDARKLFAAGFDEIRRIIQDEEPPKPSQKLSTLTADEKTTAAKARQTDSPQLINLVRGDLDWIVMKCLEKDRQRRYDSAEKLALDLQRHLEDKPILARPPGLAYKLQKFARRHKRTLSVVGAAAGFAAVTILAEHALFPAAYSHFGEIAPKTLSPAVKTTSAAAVLEIAYAEAPEIAPAGAAHPRLQFVLEARRKGDAGFSPLQDGDSLASKQDDYLIVARALSAGYLYIFEVDSSGKTQWLFPANDSFPLSSGANPVAAGQILQAPAPKNGAFYLDTVTGIEHLYVVFSAARWPRLEVALGQPPPNRSLVTIQEPNHLLSRGIGGIDNAVAPVNVTDALPAEWVDDGASFKLPMTGQAFKSTGQFLVIERWFRHVDNHVPN